MATSNPESPNEVTTNNLPLNAPAKHIGEVLDIVSKSALVGSAILYAIGLLISNLYGQSHGGDPLGLAQPQYVLAGFSWAAITGAGFLFGKTAMYLLRQIWREPHAKTLLKKLLAFPFYLSIMLSYCMSLLSIFRLGGGAPNFAQSATIIAVGGFSSLSLWRLTHEILVRVRKQSIRQDEWGERFGTHLGLLFAVSFVGSCLYLYSLLIYPLLPSVFGGALPREATVIVRQDRIQSVGEVKQLGLDKSGKSKLIAVLAESDQFLVIADPQQKQGFWSFAEYKTYVRLRKECVDAVIYTSK